MSTRLKQLPRLPGLKHLPGAGSRKKLPQPVRDTGFTLKLEEPHVMEVFARLGRRPRDYKLAKRVATLMQEFPQGTIPELVTYDWLKQNNIEFTYQAWVYGGRSREGGVIPDFVLEWNGKGLAWLIQGEYWHSKADISASDKADIIKLKGAWFHHILIEEVVEIWESDVYEKRPQVFEWGLLGIGLRG